MIAVINDNMKRLRMWESSLGSENVRIFSHPNYLLQELQSKQCEADFKIVLADRFYYGSDLLHDSVMLDIKRNLPEGTPFLVTSCAHEFGDEIDGYTGTISATPCSALKLNEALARLGSR